METDVTTGLALIVKAKEQERDDRIFQQWVAQLPTMALAGKPVSFSEYRDRVTGANIDRRPVAEIEAELDALEKSLRKEAVS